MARLRDILLVAWKDADNNTYRVLNDSEFKRFIGTETHHRYQLVHRDVLAQIKGYSTFYDKLNAGDIVDYDRDEYEDVRNFFDSALQAWEEVRWDSPNERWGASMLNGICIVPASLLPMGTLHSVFTLDKPQEFSALNFNPAQETPKGFDPTAGVKAPIPTSIKQPWLL